MAIFKCKMCGGTLEIDNNESVVECEYCGTQQTLPKLDDERKMNLYDRANHFRRNNEFDKAEGIYEQILNEDNTDAEAYWSLVLCRYGIEYVEDPTTHKRVPTVNRAQFTSVFDDDNYKSALQYADLSQKVIYEKEAREINEIQKGILAISQKEEPFDVFICYKETDNNGRRTPDSVLATDLYHQLMQEGFKVFFSRITLEDKLGSAYEPYIFAAINSAKVMVVLGTKPEYFKAVWVRNEWSRYLALIKQGQKKMLIPAYKDMDPYDLPEEFSHLQAQDMSKLGFMQDLIRGIKKITKVEQPNATVVKETIISDNNTNTTPLLKRAFMFLEDKEWDSADEYCEKVLDINPECAEAYLGKLMVELKVASRQNLKHCPAPFSKRNSFQKIMRFGDDTLQSELQGYIDYIVNRNLESAYDDAVQMIRVANDEGDYKKAAMEFQKLRDYRDSKHLYQECLDKAEEARLTGLYDTANSLMYNAKDEHAYKIAAEHFGAIKTFKDAAEKEKLCFEKAEISRKDEIYNFANFLMQDKTVASYRQAIEQLETIVEWKDSSSKIGECERGIQEVQQREEAERVEKAHIAECERLERERQEEIARQEAERIAKRKRRYATFVISAVCVVIAFIMVLKNVIIPNNAYNNAKELYEKQEYNEALVEFVKARNVKDANEYIKNIILLQRQKGKEYISTDGFQTIGLKLDGTVVATEITEYKWDEGQCDVLEWADIVAISTDDKCTVGLRKDGTVISTEITDSLYDEGQSDVLEWTDIVVISAGEFHTVGLKSDGTVVATKFISDTWDYDQSNVSSWTDIVAISAGDRHTVGLRKDGTVLAVGDNNSGQCEVAEWKDIVAIAAGSNHTVGLKMDGTVVMTGKHRFEESNVSGWSDIVAIAAGSGHSVGLKSDGTVVAVGNDFGECDVSGWKDIVAISAGDHNTVGLKIDGSVVAVGEGACGSCNVQDWNLFQ